MLGISAPNFHVRFQLVIKLKYNQVLGAFMMENLNQISQIEGLDSNQVVVPEFKVSTVGILCKCQLTCYQSA